MYGSVTLACNPRAYSVVEHCRLRLRSAAIPAPSPLSPPEVCPCASPSCSPAREHRLPAWASPGATTPRGRSSSRPKAALGEPLAPLLLDTPAEGLARTREAQLAVLCTSLVAWEAARPMLDDVVAFAGHSLGQVTALDRVRRARPRRRRAVRGPPRGADAGRGRRASRPHGRVARRDHRAGRASVRGRARRGVGRERQRARPGRDRRNSRRRRARVRARQGDRRPARHRAQRRRRVPHAADEHRARRTCRRVARRRVQATERAGRLQPRRRLVRRRRRLARPPSPNTSRSRCAGAPRWRRSPGSAPTRSSRSVTAR